jgi:murein DD-endopeptidase MepM/ murein hydrolase activator NlpD
MKTYTIKKGDTLGKIAKQFLGDSLKFKLITELNDISDPDKIKVGQKIKIPEVEKTSTKKKKKITSKTDYSALTKYHSAFADGIKWRLVDEGVEIKGSGIERSSGNPTTVGKIWESRNKEINKWAKKYSVPCELIIATIATESGNDEKARREELGFISDDKTPTKVSVGLMQTLLSTAASTLGKNDITAKWLENPSNSIQAGTSYIYEQSVTTKLDPPKVACAYNAGGIYRNQGEKNRWEMRQYPIGTSIHCDRFVKWYNDAVLMLKFHNIKPKISNKIFTK